MAEENNTGIHDLIEQETETKEPVKNESYTWNFDDKDLPEENETSSEPEQTTEKTAEPKKGKITEIAKRQSARTATGMVDVLQKSIFTPLISIKYKNKFTAEEINTIDEKNLYDKDINDIEDEDKALKNKWDRLMRKCEKKLDAIPLKDQEKKDMEEAFFVYFDITEKTLPPEWFLIFQLINSVGSRTIDLLSD